MEKISTFLVLFSIFHCISGLSLPSDFQICKRSDPKRDECLKSAIQGALPLLANGLPEFNFPSMDPIKLPSMTVAAGTGTVHVEQIYENVEFHHVQLSKIEKVESTLTDKEFKLVIYITKAVLSVDVQYTFDGNVLFLPIVGKGPGNLTAKNVTSILTLEGEIIEKKGKKYVDVKTSAYKMTPGLVILDFKNLFNGDPILGPEMLAILNESWEELYGDVGHGYEAGLAAIFHSLANAIFKKIPYDEIFPK